MEKVLFKDLVLVFTHDRNFEYRNAKFYCYADETGQNYVDLQTDQKFTYEQLEDNNRLLVITYSAFCDMLIQQVQILSTTNKVNGLRMLALDFKALRIAKFLEKAERKGIISVKKLLKIQKHIAKIIKLEEKAKQKEKEKQRKNNELRSAYYDESVKIQPIDQDKQQQQQINKEEKNKNLVDENVIKAEKEVEEVFQKVIKEMNENDNSITL